MLALAVHTKAPVAVDFTKLVELVNKVKVSGETKVTMTGLGDKPVALKHAVRSFAEKGGKLEKNTHGEFDDPTAWAPTAFAPTPSTLFWKDTIAPFLTKTPVKIMVVAGSIAAVAIAPLGLMNVIPGAWSNPPNWTPQERFCGRLLNAVPALRFGRARRLGPGRLCQGLRGGVRPELRHRVCRRDRRQLRDWL